MADSRNAVNAQGIPRGTLEQQAQRYANATVRPPWKLAAIIVLSVIALIAAVFAPADQMGELYRFLGPALTMLIAAQLQEVHKIVNSRASDAENKIEALQVALLEAVEGKATAAATAEANRRYRRTDDPGPDGE